MLTTRVQQRIDNKIKQRAVTGWTMIGASYPQRMQGRRMPGCLHLDLEGGGFIYYTETTTLDAALDDADDRGFDTKEVRIRLDRWVATGNPDPDAQEAIDRVDQQFAEDADPIDDETGQRML